ncbi:MAG: tRNA (adenosine(37)-N6)-threonylcarbamoyltransferase complex ATPase subunit type 1 TsaE [Chloroflexi bacterium]|nr:tRNA (adenosine(37)-N6)-threonylcarbamoyltransferase complex ATPase subunit type 1 TsaE [Chloroflexota bacterium]
MHPNSTAAIRGGEWSSTDVEVTRALGRALGRAANPGTVLALIGPLGAGKTQLAKGVADGLEVIGVVNSPTFILMNEHPGRLRMYHIDAYRLGDPEEAVAAGLLDERQVDGVTVIEWADRLTGWLPPERLEIELMPGAGEGERTLRWSAHGASHERLARRVGDLAS